jgi:hypothetical protein
VRVDAILALWLCNFAIHSSMIRTSLGLRRPATIVSLDIVVLLIVIFAAAALRKDHGQIASLHARLSTRRSSHWNVGRVASASGPSATVVTSMLPR